MRRGFPFTLSGRRGYGLAVACVVVATGAIMLIRARRDADAAPPVMSRPTLDLSSAPPPGADGVDVPRLTFEHPGLSGSLTLAQGAVLAGGTRQVHAQLLAVAEPVDGEQPRQPVALAVVLDVSGSMNGEKIEEAKEAVAALINAMDGRDQIALVTYHSNAEVVHGLSEVGHVRHHLIARVRQITAGGGTHIPDGLAAGTNTLRGARAGLARRVVLISDGLDGSGWDLGTIGSYVTERADTGLTFSSLGVGTDYSEPFLMTVSNAGHGNYEFLASGAQLRGFLNRELLQASSTAVDQVWVSLRLPSGWRLSEAYGVSPRGTTGTILVPMGSMYGGERRQATFAFEIEAGAAGQTLAFGTRLRYRRASDEEAYDVDLGTLALRTVADQREVLTSRSNELYADSVTTVVDAQQARAVEAWRAGRRDEAIALSNSNIENLEQMQAISFSQERAARISEFNADNDNFMNNDAQSQAGRAYGLRANQMRRTRSRGN